MRVLEELEREIERVAAQAGDTRPRRRWWRWVAALVALPLGVAAVAVAATSGLLSGQPVRNPPGLQLNPKAALGVIVGSGRLLSVRAADPAGGPEWGLRLVKTSRGLGCVQLGRVVDGKLGVLGRDGAFNDDGKFHESGPQIVKQIDCEQTNAAGRTFIAVSYIGLPDSAEAASCAPRGYPGDLRTRCASGSLRTVYYGLLGPDAKAVTYVAAGGRIIRDPVVAPDGAYLVVLPTDPHLNHSGFFVPSATPETGLRSVEYRDGSICRIVSARGRRGGARACPLKGFVAPKLPAVTHAELATAVHVHIGKQLEHPSGKLRLPRGERTIPAQRSVTIVFRARRAADARSFYTISAHVLSTPNGCADTFGPIAKDVVAGQVLKETLYFSSRCHATMAIAVGYTQQRHPTQTPFDIRQPGNAKVGRAVVKLP